MLDVKQELIKKGKTHNRLLAEINITSLVDVALMLLIAFMITAPLLQEGMPVNLPQAQASALKRSKADIILTIQKDGSIFIGDEGPAIPAEEIQGRLAAIYEAKQQRDLFIKADTDVRYGEVVQIMSFAKKAGVDRIGMITSPELETEEPEEADKEKS